MSVIYLHRISNVRRATDHYAIFAFNLHTPHGGMNDCKGFVATELDAYHALCHEITGYTDYQIVDLARMETV